MRRLFNCKDEHDKLAITKGLADNYNYYPLTIKPMKNSSVSEVIELIKTGDIAFPNQLDNPNLFKVLHEPKSLQSTDDESVKEKGLVSNAVIQGSYTNDLLNNHRDKVLAALGVPAELFSDEVIIHLDPAEVDEPISAYQILSDRIRSLLDRWDGYYTTHKNLPYYMSFDKACMKGLLDEINDGFTEKLLNDN
jgi:hypothetical protein